MKQEPLQVLAVVGTMQRNSALSAVIHQAAELFRAVSCQVDVLDLKKEPLALYDPEAAYELPGYTSLQVRVDAAEVILLGTPDYHGSISSALKNFLDHFWHEFAGKLFVTIVASREKGLTVADQLRTVARQCYAWTLPYAIAFNTEADIKDGSIVNEGFRQRLNMMIRDARVYGELLARQRRNDLTAADTGFLAHYQK